MYSIYVHLCIIAILAENFFLSPVSGLWHFNDVGHTAKVSETLSPSPWQKD
jgi:hypothetical protein